MVFPVVGGDGKPTGYEISNSMRFGGQNGNAVLQKTFSSEGNRKKFTIATWVKANGVFSYISGTQTTGQEYFQYGFTDNGTIRVFQGDGSLDVEISRRLRDPSAWYHLVLQVDTTQGTASNRIKFYVNGTQETSMASTTYPSQNLDLFHNTNSHAMGIGNRGDADGAFLKGYLADYYFVDNATVAQSTFAETDDNGVWIPKDSADVIDAVTFGTNGFFLNFQQTGTSANSSGMGADTSGNDNHFASTNTDTSNITEDTPTNNFSTLNPLSPTSGNPVYAEGNLKISASGADAYSYFPSTFGLSNGKWYAEVKVNSQGGNTFIGIAETSMEAYNTGANNDPHLTAGTIWYANGGNGYYDGSSQDASTFGAASFTSGDIIGLALDLDSGTKTIKFYKNGSLTATKNLTSNFVDPIVFAANLFNTQNQSWNFGNPPFSISSGNADANGYGNFEYAPPSGYYSCCTKNLAEYG